MPSREFDVVIPARYDSRRLPGKALLDICGKTLIRRVYETGLKSSAANVIVATDDQRICDEVTAFGGVACLTAEDHSTGTDRIAEAIEARKSGGDRIIVNLQGDEPFLPDGMIDSVVETLISSAAAMSTACHKIMDTAEIDDPNVVKVVTDKSGFALYFSRYPIPYPRDGARHAPTLRHIGLYACNARFLRHYLSLPSCQMERDEQLEQLRVLYHGERIAVVESHERPGPGIDTREDLEAARTWISAERI